jgi:capsular polysaccharide transport system permease protein
MRNGTTLGRSLQIQLRVTGALLIREIVTRYGRDNLGFLWLFFEPMLFTLGVMGLWSLTGQTHGHGVPVAAFAITGYSPVLLWRNCASRVSLVIQQNVGLLYHRNIRVLDLVFARILLEIAGATMSFVVLVLLFASMGFMEWPEDITGILAGWLLLAWFGAALALIIGGLTAHSEVAERLWHPAAYLLFPISGAVFMVAWLPKEFQDLVLLVPMVSGVEILREGYFGSLVHARYDVPYMVGACLILTLLGMLLMRGADRALEGR